MLAEQEPDVLDVVLGRAAEVGATVLREGVDFGVSDRLTALGGQQVDLQGVAGTLRRDLPAAARCAPGPQRRYALAAVEAFTGSNELDADLVHAAFADVSSPGRLEVVRRSPTVLLDAAHNPHGIEAALEAVQDAFTFSPLIGVVGVMADKDVDEIVRLLEPVLAEIVCTQNSTPRAMPAAELGEIADDVFGADRVTVVRRLDDAIERAIAFADSGGGYEDAIGSGGVLITGSVVTVGEARLLFGGEPQ